MVSEDGIMTLAPSYRAVDSRSLASYVYQSGKCSVAVWSCNYCAIFGRYFIKD